MPASCTTVQHAPQKASILGPNLNFGPKPLNATCIHCLLRHARSSDIHHQTCKIITDYSGHQVTWLACSQGSDHTVEIIAAILLPVAILMCVYALTVFIWRSKAISKKQVSTSIAPLERIKKVYAVRHHDVSLCTPKQPETAPLACISWRHHMLCSYSLRFGNGLLPLAYRDVT